jgi:hypothetical protein
LLEAIIQAGIVQYLAPYRKGLALTLDQHLCTNQKPNDNQQFIEHGFIFINNICILIELNILALLLDHHQGNYQFLKGIGPYSCGVVAMPGYEIVHSRLMQPVPLHLGYQQMVKRLEKEGRSIKALCGMQLRIPTPLSFEGFSHFNQEYQHRLKELDLFLDDINPLARTNIAIPALGIREPMLHAFSYTIPSDLKSPTFVVAGAGDLKDQTDLSPDAIVRPGETSGDALQEKASVVMAVMEERLAGLQVDWPLATTVDVYTVYPVQPYLVDTILKPIGKASWHGVNWYYGEPPIQGLGFEMDVRGVRTEQVI